MRAAHLRVAKSFIPALHRCPPLLHHLLAPFSAFPWPAVPFLSSPFYCPESHLKQRLVCKMRLDSLASACATRSEQRQTTACAPLKWWPREDSTHEPKQWVVCTKSPPTSPCKPAACPHARRALLRPLSSAAHVLIPVHIWLKHLGADTFPPWDEVTDCSLLGPDKE